MDIFDKVANINPAKSTVYMANLPYELRTTEIQEIFEKYGKIVKVTLLTVKETRKSKGVAFVLYEKPEDARRCVENSHNKMVLGQMVRISLAKDNGKRANLSKPKRIE